MEKRLLEDGNCLLGLQLGEYGPYLDEGGHVIALYLQCTLEVLEGLDDIAVVQVQSADVVLDELGLFVGVYGQAYLQCLLYFSLSLQDVGSHDQYLQGHWVPLQDQTRQAQSLLNCVFSEGVAVDELGLDLFVVPPEAVGFLQVLDSLLDSVPPDQQLPQFHKSLCVVVSRAL